METTNVSPGKDIFFLLSIKQTLSETVRAGRPEREAAKLELSMSAASKDLLSVSGLADLTSDFTTWSENTEDTEVNSQAEKWRELRTKVEPLLVVARRAMPFASDQEEREFQKATLHFYGAMKAAEGANARLTPGAHVEGAGDLLHMATVLTDTTNVIYKLYSGPATKEHAMEVLTALLTAFDARVQCHGPHGK